MAPTAPTNTEPAVAQAQPHPPPPQQPVSALPANPVQPDIASMSLAGIDQNQILTLLRSVGVFPRLDQAQAGKEDAAQTLSALATQASAFQIPGVHYPPPPAAGVPGVNDPGPSSHPRGPPNLSQLSSVAMQAAPAPRPEDQQAPRDDQANGGVAPVQPKPDANVIPQAPASTTPPSTGGGRRGGRSAAMGSDEWSRQRKDNHKEVERRRRGNINEGINELGRIVPNGNGEKAKGAILARAVQYIHHLKENEARNIEKWTLEKLLMDQAMGDLQAQLEEVKRLWEEERLTRQRLESELEVLRGMNNVQQSNNAPQEKDAPAPVAAPAQDGNKRRSPDGEDAATNEAEDEREGKRQRTE